jgi:L-ornithine N5-oxygenase
MSELTAQPGRVAVIGAGQSVAEVTNHLHRTFPRAEVHAIATRAAESSDSGRGI